MNTFLSIILKINNIKCDTINYNTKMIHSLTDKIELHALPINSSKQIEITLLKTNESKRFFPKTMTIYAFKENKKLYDESISQSKSIDLIDPNLSKISNKLGFDSQKLQYSNFLLDQVYKNNIFGEENEYTFLSSGIFKYILDEDKKYLNPLNITECNEEISFWRYRYNMCKICDKMTKTLGIGNEAFDNLNYEDFLAFEKRFLTYLLFYPSVILNTQALFYGFPRKNKYFKNLNLKSGSVFCIELKLKVFNLEKIKGYVFTEFFDNETNFVHVRSNWLQVMGDGETIKKYNIADSKIVKKEEY